MGKGKEVFELHKKILDSDLIVPENENFYLKYSELSRVEEEELISYTLKEYEMSEDNQELGDILSHIAMFSKGDSLVKLYPSLIENNIFLPSEIYLKAGEKEAKLLIEKVQKVDSDDSLKVDHILKCLSYIPCDIVKDFLLKKSEKPIEYTLYGGWTIDKNNKIKKLYNDEVTVFKKNNKDIECLKAPLKISKDICPYCANNLTLICNDEFELKTCLYCTCYQNILTKINENGKACWYDKNEKSDFLNEMLGEDTEIAPFDYSLKESDEKRLPAYTVSQFINITKSQIGGMPTWINDPEYPICPECGELMTFVAQLDMEDVDEYGDGFYYFFYCPNCKIVSSGYGQS